MAGYPHIRYISSGLDGTSFRGPFRGNFEVRNEINEDTCHSIFSAKRICVLLIHNCIGLPWCLGIRRQ